jgi:hypothetical protein
MWLRLWCFCEGPHFVTGQILTVDGGLDCDFRAVSALAIRRKSSFHGLASLSADRFILLSERALDRSKPRGVQE